MRVAIIWNTILFLIALVLIVGIIRCVIPQHKCVVGMSVPQGDPFISMNVENKR